MKKFYFLAFLCFSGATFAQSPLLGEDFDYPAGDALTDHGWLNHSGTTGPILVTSPGLTFTGYVGSGIGLAAGLNSTTQKVNKSFGAQTSGSVYASFIVNATVTATAGDCFFHIFDPLQAASVMRGKVYLANGSTTGKMKLGLAFSSTSPTYYATELDFGTTYLVVLKYIIIDGLLNDQVSLYVFQAGDDFSTEPTTPAVGPLTGSGADIPPTSIALRQFDAAQRITVDGIRVKTIWQLDKDILSGLNQQGISQQIGFYPNPVTDGYLNISSSSKSLKQIEIFDVVGKKVFSETSLSNRINVSDLKAGIYILKMEADNQSTSSRLVIK